MSSSPESSVMKQPIRRLEIQISNFNVAIPHHVDLLKRHKNNIKKYEAQQDWERVHKEHVNVSRIVTQLKELVYQMDTLRAQVLDTDINQFDKLTKNARCCMMNAMKEYLELELNVSMSQPISPKDEEHNVHHPLDECYVQLQEEQEKLQHQQSCLNAWNALQGDIQQLHQLFAEFNKVVNDQKDLVNNAENDIDETQVNVQEGAKFLEKASRYKIATYPIAGAVLGTCIGGPIGLVAGLKIGGLAALGCGILGFTGGNFLKNKEIEMNKTGRITEASSSSSEEQAVVRSISLSDTKQDKKEL